MDRVLRAELFPNFHYANYYSKVSFIRYSLARIARSYVFFLFLGGNTVFDIFTHTFYSFIRIFPRSLWKTYQQDKKFCGSKF